MSRDVKFKEKLASKKSHEFPAVVIENKDQEALKVEQHAKGSNLGSQPSGGEDSMAPSSFTIRPKCFE